MVFVSGARPVGKTFIARQLPAKLDVPGFPVCPEGPIQRHERLGWKMPSGSFLRGLLLTPPGEDVSADTGRPPG